MTWLLTAKSGSSRGESWMIGTKPIILGRSLSCDITIGDPTVSRKHCEVRLEGDGVVFRDLGSRNVSLVNGRAVEQCRLLVGDELSLGTESFILTRALSNDSPLPPEPDHVGNTTVSLDDALHLTETDGGTQSNESFPATVQELLRLYHFGRKLSKAHSAAEFASLCIQELEEAFPARIEPAVCCVTPNGLTWYPKGFSPTQDLLDQVWDTMRRSDATLSSYRAKRLFFKEVVIAGTAPLVATGHCHGALVILSAARDYIPEPGALTHLNAIAQTASPYLGSIEQREAQRLSTDNSAEPETVEFLGDSADVEVLRAEIQGAARSGQNTLITGEPGTGKELAAHLIHNNPSTTAPGPIVSVNCITLRGEQFMTALCGSEESTEGDGVTIRRGLLDQANGGTLVLRELDALTSSNQAELVHVLQRGSYSRTGTDKVLPFCLRVIGTSSHDLEMAVSQGAFRRDLLRLIGRQRIHIKPLRRRPMDIRALAEHFVDSGKRQGNHESRGLTEEALAYLEELPLRGNAIELRNTINQAALHSRSGWIGTQEIRSVTRPDAAHEAVLGPLEKAERMLIGAVLTQCEGNTRAAAEILGLPLEAVEKLVASRPHPGNEKG